MKNNPDSNSLLSKVKKLIKSVNRKSSLDRFDKFMIILLSTILIVIGLAIVVTKFIYNFDSVLNDEDVVQEYSHTNQFQLRTYGEDLTKNMENTESPANEATPISVWGDSYCVAGNATIPSLAAYLSKYANRLVYNVAVPSDTLEMTAARQGGIPMYVSPCDIKREKSSIEVTLKNSYGTTLTPSLEKNGGLNPCKINGIEGVLYELEGKYYFTRSASGNEEIITNTNVPVVTKAMDMRREDISVFFVGDDEIFSDPQKTVEIYKKMTEYLQTDKFLIIGPVYGNTADILKTNAALEAEFGEKYFNLLNYLCKDAIEKYNFTLSDEDAKKVKNYQLTAGYFLSDGFFSNDVNNICGLAIYEKLMDLGYFK